MRQLIPERSGELSPEELALAYAVPGRPWLRANMISTVDGAATGADGRTGSVNNAADKQVFDLLRSLADAVIVGAGTARTERYGPVDRPIVVVSRRGDIPETLRDGPPGSVLLATCSSSSGLPSARDLLGPENVLVAGESAVDPMALRSILVGRGLTSLLCEGGPTLLADCFAAGVVDELCSTVVPHVLGAAHRRIASGAPSDVALRLGLLLEHRSTLIARWLVSRADGPA